VNEDIIISAFFFTTVTVLGLGIPLVRAHIRRMDRRAGLPPSNGMSDERLARIEQAIDAMSVEVERISEGQRFVTRVLAERPAEQSGLPSSRSPVADTLP
jgi:hypothetical protein